ncbi:MAG: MBL fold metallo-hydrolase [Bacteroidia bacterium]|nr:MBL fold metallo-hydrolase [Bacteroidia bacterium]MDW8015847.1 MBL fold metallo-hydrolase [Bacteroidia bacterium]
MRLHRFVTNPYQENTYLLVGSEGTAWVIDPGFYTETERKTFQSILSAEKARLSAIYLTHAHIDHILGVRWIVETYQVPLYYHKGEEVIYQHAPTWASLMGLIYTPGPFASRYLEEGEILSLDGEPLTVLFLPGHSPGHVGFYAPESKKLFSGDVLFRGSIGNYELPLSDYETLMTSLQQKVLSLPEDTEVWPGHGEPTFIGYERQTNPFLQRI